MEIGMIALTTGTFSSWSTSWKRSANCLEKRYRESRLELNLILSPWVFDSHLYHVTAPPHGLHELDRQSQQSRRGCHCWKRRINFLPFLDDFSLPSFSDQGPEDTVDRFATACNQAGMNISTKKTKILCLWNSVSIRCK